MDSSCQLELHRGRSYRGVYYSFWCLVTQSSQSGTGTFIDEPEASSGACWFLFKQDQTRRRVSQETPSQWNSCQNCQRKHIEVSSHGKPMQFYSRQIVGMTWKLLPTSDLLNSSWILQPPGYIRGRGWHQHSLQCQCSSRRVIEMFFLRLEEYHYENPI